MVASIWRRAWASRASSTAPQGGGGGRGGGGSLQPTCGRSTTSGTTYTTTAATSDSAGGWARDSRPFVVVLPTVPVEEENTEELDIDKEIETDRVRKLEHIEGLVMEFRGGNLGALQKWLLDLDVGWVLNLAEIDESAGSVLIWRQFQYFADSSWIPALSKIGESIFSYFDPWCSSQEQDEGQGTSKQPLISEFVQLVEAAVLKMLTFVDAIIAAAARPNDRSGAMPLSDDKLQVLTEVHDALSMALEPILSLSISSPFGEYTEGKMRNLLSADMAKLDEAIWGTIVEIRNSIMAWMDDGGGGDPYSSSDIHKITRSVMRCTNVLSVNYYKSVNRILHEAVLRGEYQGVPENENVSLLSSLIIEMALSLEEKLAVMSRSWFPDQGLGFLFLINNSDFILQQLHGHYSCFPLLTLSHKTDGYINSYLQVSWAPVLKCLQDPATPHCFTRRSPLTKFKSKFGMTYTVQKLRKVPDPDMRKRLRKAIIEKVIPVFTQFLEDNSISALGVITPRMAEEMLADLFEG